MAFQNLNNWISSRQATRVLLGLNVLVTLWMVWTTRDLVLADAWSYIALANGLLHGEYSMWYELEGSYPDTVRAPGFPLLIALAIAVFGSWKAVIGINLALYAVALWCTLRIIARYDPRPLAQNLFLLVLLPMVYVPYYVSQVYTEIPVLAAISVVLYVGMRPGPLKWYASIGLGLLFGLLVQFKPVFLLFPPVYAICRWWWVKGWVEARAQFLMLAIFGVTLLPYGLWNLRHHEVFKVTPLEGGAGVMHFGYWCGKLPAYTEKVYWHNFSGDEVVQFVRAENVPRHIAAYEQEWEEINAQLRPLLTAKDSAMFDARKVGPTPRIYTFNTRYTRLREELLFAKAREHLLDDLSYTIPYKLYSAFRFWVIGIQRGEFAASSLSGKLRLLYATGSTLIVFLLFLVLVPWAMARRGLGLAQLWQPLLFMAYVGLMHVPFAIQARYTVPVRFAMFMVLAWSIAALVGGALKSRGGEA